jgi:hypothetical protein
MRGPRLLLVVVASALLLSAASILMQPAHAGAPTTVDARRGFYLTKGRYNGGKALTACATGYHMASIWEIKETAFLRYDNTLGRNYGDSVHGGPPSSTVTESMGIGWIRAGSDLRNCKQWTSNSASDFGTQGSLFILSNNNSEPTWAVGDGGICDVVSSNTHLGVWCVQN